VQLVSTSPRGAVCSIRRPASGRKRSQLSRTVTILSRLPRGFLKSRVYAKLLTRLILECYQTFNGQTAEAEAGAASYCGLSNRQTGQFACNGRRL